MFCEQIILTMYPQKTICMPDLATLTSVDKNISGILINMKEVFLWFANNADGRRFCGQIRPQLCGCGGGGVWSQTLSANFHIIFLP
jgi:hypothetical protein